MTNPIDLEDLAAKLEQSGTYRVLRKLKPPPLDGSTSNSGDKLAVFVDVETTGLDPTKDEIIEIALIRFRYSVQGSVTAIIDAFDQLREPSIPIPDVATSITGITNEMVAGCRIDEKAVTEIAGPADLVIAHNAIFDRQFLERLFPIFASKPWACSMSEIDWESEGFEGRKLAYLASDAGFFYDRHRAENDCFAAIELLRRNLPNSGETGMAALLDRARQTTWRIWAEGTPYETKDILKARGYRWSTGENGAPRAWYIDATDNTKDVELEIISGFSGKPKNLIRMQKITAKNRYSDRLS